MENNIVIENNFDELDEFINDPKNIIELANELAKDDYEKNFDGKSEKEIDDMYFSFLRKGIYGEEKRRHYINIEEKHDYFMDMDNNEFEVKLNDYKRDCVSDNVYISFLEEKSYSDKKEQEPDCYSDGHDLIFNKSDGDGSAIPRIDVLRGYHEKGHKFECIIDKTIDEKNSIITMLKHMIILDILALKHTGFAFEKNNNLTIKEQIINYCQRDLIVERRKAFLVGKIQCYPEARTLYSSQTGMLAFHYKDRNYLHWVVYNTERDNCRNSCISDKILSNIFMRYVKYLMYNSINGLESVENNGWTLEERMICGVSRALENTCNWNFVNTFVDYLNSTNELERYFFYGDKACNFKSCFCKNPYRFETVCSLIIKNNPNAFDEFYLKVGAKKFIEQMILFLDCETIVEIKNGKRTYDQEYKNMLSNQSEMIGKRLAVILRCLNIIGFENAFREYLNQNQIEDKIKNEIFEACKKYKSQSNDMQKNNMDANDYRSEFENEYFLPDKLLEYDVSENEVALQIKTENNFQQTPVQQSSYINFFVYIFSGLTIIFSLLIFVYTYFFIAALTFLILSVICLIIKFCYGKNENDIDIKPQKTKTNTIPLNKYIEKNENDLNLEDTNKITLTRDYQEEN